MSIQRMRSRFARQLRIALYVLIGAFIIGLPLMFAVPGSPLGRQRQEQRPPAQDVIARVNDRPVMRADLDAQFERLLGQVASIYAQMGQPVGLERLWQFRLDALQQAIDLALMQQDAEQRGLTVSKGDLKEAAQRAADQTVAQIKSQVDPEQYEVTLARIVRDNDPTQVRDTMKERDFRKWLLDRMLAPESSLRSDLLIEKLRPVVTGQVSATEEDLLASYDVARVRHILVSTRPPEGKERTQEEARQRAEELLARVRGGESFEAVAKTSSDDPAAQANGGLMENVSRGRMPAAWDAAVFALKPGQVSEPIELPWGYEVVTLESVERKLPEDLERNKEKLLNDLSERKRMDAWSQYVESLRKKAAISYEAPEMLAYQALEQGNQEEALTKLEAAAERAQDERGLGGASVFYQLATLYASRNEWEKAAEAYGRAGDALLGGEDKFVPGGRAEALLGMGRSYENLGKVDDAVMWYTAAGDATQVPSLHSQLEMTFRRLGREDLAAQETQWLADFAQREKERQEALAAQQKAMEEEQARPRPPDAQAPQ